MLNLFLSKDWIANREEVLRRISQDVRLRKENRILMVPELISHEMERKLCAAAGDTASRYAEVLSFTRLARRVFDTMGNAAEGCMDNGGRVVAMAATARQLTSQLKAYASVETKPEFLSGLLDCVDEFKRCCITSQDLLRAANESHGSLAQKLEELALLMEGYEGICSRGKRDPRDQMTWLLEYLELGSFAEEHVFYIDGFPDFTRQNLAIIEHLIKHSPSVTVSLNCDTLGSQLLAFEKAGDTAQEIYQLACRAGVEIRIEVIPERTDKLQYIRNNLFQGAIVKGFYHDTLHVYQAETAYQECLNAAQQVMTLVRSGCRYRDIALVCTDLTVYQPLVDLIFRRFHIPVYRSGTEEILQKSVIVTVLTALDAVLGGFDQRDVMQYLRSALSPLSPDESDLLENYVILWGIRGKLWTLPWTKHPDGLGGEWDSSAHDQLKKLNDMREIVMQPLMELQQAFRTASNLKSQICALYSFLEHIRLEQRLDELSREMDAVGDYRSAQILNQLWEILLSALEQVYDVLGQTVWEPEHFVRLLRLLLSQYDVGTIPPVLDAVQMGAISAMRCNQQKHLIILGAEEGKLPGYTGSAGILTDQERVALRELGVPLTGGAMEGIQAEFAEIYGVFCGATESVRIYCSGEQPSYIFRRLSQMAGDVTQVRDDFGFAQADEIEAATYLARWNAEEDAKRLHLTSAYDKACQHRVYELGKVDSKNLRKLYGETLNLSASQIDRQAECRLSYFLRYGLRAKERKEVTVDPAEFGTYVHAVLENTARYIQTQGGFHHVSLEDTLEVAHRFSDEYAAERFSQLETERLTYLFKRNMRELDMVVEELWRELSESLFEPGGFEVNFGKGGDLPPIVIPNNSMNALLRGFVDRVDVWKTSGSCYYRVVDYKTGKKDFDYCDVFNGVGLQMLLYLFALRNSGADILGDHPVPAGVQYFPARVPYISADGKMSEDDADQERRAHWKRRGLLLSDEAVLQAMEPRETPQRLCFNIKKDGTVTGDLADREQLELLERYIFRFLAGMIDDIASGNVEPNPYSRGSVHSACTFCPYGSVCHESNVKDRRNYKAMTAQRFWDELEKEMRKYGG